MNHGTRRSGVIGGLDGTARENSAKNSLKFVKLSEIPK
jgi:hypothetical protein